jgi:hypothetical protein
MIVNADSRPGQMHTAAATKRVSQANIVKI